MKLPAEVANSLLFDGVDGTGLEIAAQALRPLSFRAGQRIFEAGDEGHALYIIQRGKVKISHCNLDGKEKILAYLSPGKIFGEMSLVEEKPRSASAQAINETVLYTLYAEEYWSLIKRYPRVAHNLARVLAQRLREMNHEVEVLTFEESRGRVAYALLKLYRHEFGEPTRRGRVLPLTQRELADIAGTSRETVTRVINEFQNRGYLRSETGQIEVFDPAGLEKVLYDLE
ncbi:Crp/Fnr family transcriptional regulator [Oceanithermus sp.]